MPEINLTTQIFNIRKIEQDLLSQISVGNGLLTSVEPSVRQPLVNVFGDGVNQIGRVRLDDDMRGFARGFALFGIANNLSAMYCKDLHGFQSTQCGM